MNRYDIKLPIERGTKENYNSIQRKPNYLYLINNAGFNEPTILLGDIVLARATSSSKIVSSVIFDENTLSLKVDYDDGSSETIPLYKGEMIRSVQYDVDKSHLIFNSDIIIDLSPMKYPTTNSITAQTNTNFLPTVGAVLRYLDSKNIGSMEMIYTLIADALRDRYFFPEADTLQGILDAIHNMGNAEVINPRLSSKIDKFLWGWFYDEFSLIPDRYEFIIEEQLDKMKLPRTILTFENIFQIEERITTKSSFRDQIDLPRDLWSFNIPESLKKISPIDDGITHHEDLVLEQMDEFVIFIKNFIDELTFLFDYREDIEEILKISFPLIGQLDFEHQLQIFSMLNSVPSKIDGVISENRFEPNHLRMGPRDGLRIDSRVLDDIVLEII